MFRILIQVLALAMLLAGCGSSGENFATSGQGQGTQAPGPTTATVQLQSVLAQNVLAQTVVPFEIDTLRATGFNQNSELRFGPVPQAKAAVLEWSDVPVEVTRIVIEYLSNGQVVGVARVEVSLTPGQVFIVINPTIEWLTSPASLQSLSLSEGPPSISEGESTTFVATGTFSDGTTQDLSALATWSSSEATVATVDRGVARGLQAGTTVITATFNGQQASATLQVTAAQPTVTGLSVQTAVAGASTTLFPGQTLALKALATDSTGAVTDVTEQVAWSADPGAVARVSANGVVTGLASGQVTVTASFAGQGASLEITVLTVGGGGLPPTPSTRPSLTLDMAGTYTFNIVTGILTAPDSTTTTATGWNGTTGRLELNSFTINSGTTLQFTGSGTFEVDADGNITIAGTLDRNGVTGPTGATGATGAPGTAGGAGGTGGTGATGGRGGDGGSVTLSTRGNLIVSGKLQANGGTGGAGGVGGAGGAAGGSVGPTTPRHGGQGGQGGQGGNGGNGGTISLTVAGTITGTIEAVGGLAGNGGQGGNGSAGSAASGIGTSDGGRGGQGGIGGQGGQGGQGGTITTSGGGSPTILADGGQGGQGGQGGAGGQTGVALGETPVGGKGGEGGQGGQGGSEGTVNGAPRKGGLGGNGGVGGVGGDATNASGGVGGDGGAGGQGGQGGDNTRAGDGGKGGDGGAGGSGGRAAPIPGAALPGAGGAPGGNPSGATGGPGGSGGAGGAGGAPSI